MRENSKHQKFIKLPEYPGGKEEFIKFIKSNLKYPNNALINKVEGLVILSADINDNGDVLNIRVEKGIGYGCDEEAIRLLGILKYGGVKNRGRRVKVKRKFKINFKLPANPGKTISYSLKTNKKQPPKEEVKQSKKYSYTIGYKKNS